MSDSHDTHDAPAAHGHGAHDIKAKKKQYMVVFAALAILTIIEVGVAKFLHDSRGLMIALLIMLALVKAGCVAMYYMHLNMERKGLRYMVGIPMLFPPLAATVLIIEAIARGGFFFIH